MEQLSRFQPLKGKRTCTNDLRRQNAGLNNPAGKAPPQNAAQPPLAQPRLVKPCPSHMGRVQTSAVLLAGFRVGP